MAFISSRLVREKLWSHTLCCGVLEHAVLVRSLRRGYGSRNQNSIVRKERKRMDLLEHLILLYWFGIHVLSCNIECNGPGSWWNANHLVCHVHERDHRFQKAWIRTPLPAFSSIFRNTVGSDATYCCFVSYMLTYNRTCFFPVRYLHCWSWFQKLSRQERCRGSEKSLSSLVYSSHSLVLFVGFSIAVLAIILFLSWFQSSTSCILAYSCGLGAYCAMVVSQYFSARLDGYDNARVVTDRFGIPGIIVWDLRCLEKSSEISCLVHQEESSWCMIYLILFTVSLCYFLLMDADDARFSGCRYFHVRRYFKTYSYINRTHHNNLRRLGMIFMKTYMPKNITKVSKTRNILQVKFLQDAEFALSSRFCCLFTPWILSSKRSEWCCNERFESCRWSCVCCNESFKRRVVSSNSSVTSDLYVASSWSVFVVFFAKARISSASFVAFYVFECPSFSLMEMRILFGFTGKIGIPISLLVRQRFPDIFFLGCATILLFEFFCFNLFICLWRNTFNSLNSILFKRKFRTLCFNRSIFNEISFANVCVFAIACDRELDLLELGERTYCIVQ